MDDELARIIDAFLRKHRKLAKPGGATSQCAIATQDLVTDLTDAGRRARAVWFKGHRWNVPFRRPDGDVREEHTAVLVDDQTVVDITRRQYDPHADLPTVYKSVDAAGRDWREVLRGRGSEHDSPAAYRAAIATARLGHSERPESTKLAIFSLA